MPSPTFVTKILAILGTILAWFPIVAPVLLSVIVSFQERRLLFDYLMPAELFPFALAGGLLLGGAALRAKSRRGWILGGFGVAIVSLASGLGYASLSGLASGETAPTGLPWILVLASLVVYTLALVVVAVGGGAAGEGPQQGEESEQ